MKPLVAAVALVATVLAVYVLRLDDAAGLYKDDAYYMVLAQSLARGEGYALSSSATAPILPAFPPGFALVLAPIFAVAPRYPDNLVFLKAVSITAMIGVGLLTFRYWQHHRGIARGRAVVIAVLTALTPAFVFLATSAVMSECLFTLALMASAVALEDAARAEDRSQLRRATVLAALMTAAAWLIRSAGIAMVGGGVLFLAWKRGWRAAAGFLIVCLISYAPWAAYAATHRPTDAERAAHGGDVVGTRSVTGTLQGNVGQRVLDNLVNVFGRDVGAMIFPAGYRGAAESGLEAFVLTGAREFREGSMGIGPIPVAVSGVLTLFVMVGAFAMAGRRMGIAEYFCVLTIVVVVVTTSDAVYRYVLPLAPFVMAFFLIGVEAVATSLRAGTGPSAFRIAAACVMIALITEHAHYIWLKTQTPPPPFIEDNREVRLVADFIDAHLPATAKVASTNPGLVYLLTGRKAVALIDPLKRLEQWEIAGIHYAAALHRAPDLGDSVPHHLLFESPRLKLWVVQLGTAGPADRK